MAMYQRELTSGKRRDATTQQSGSVLILTLAVVLFTTIIAAVLITYANTSQKTSVAYRDIRDARYAGDGAIQSAVNWASNRPNVAKDPNLGGTVDDCVFKVTTDVGPVTVTCAAEAGSQSGAPTDLGLLPPEALVLTGNRTVSGSTNPSDSADNGEPGPFNAPMCKGWWDVVADFFYGNFDPNASIDYREYSVLFKPRVGLGTLNASCNSAQTRPWKEFKVQGDVAAAGRIKGFGAAGGFRSVSSDGVSTPKVYARYDCFGGGQTCVTAMPNRVAGPDVPSDLVGTPMDSDPGRDPAQAGQNRSPIDLRTAFLPVGFAANGTLASGYTSTGAGANYPIRTSAFLMAADGTLSAITSCPAAASASSTIVFLPGWYRDANVVNKFTANSSCNDRTIWMAPDPGADGKLLTEDDKTGSFYFDFMSNSAATSEWTCGATPSNGPVAVAQPHRWCIGRNANGNPRVVAGTPVDWTPLGPGSSPTQKPVTIGLAGTVDTDLSAQWNNGNGAKAIGGGSPAEYSPVMFSIDRSIRLRNYTPKVTTGPVDNKIFVNAAYAFTGGHPLFPVSADVEVRSVSAESGQKYCGRFNLPYVSGSVQTVSISAADAQTLSTNCGQIDRINGLELRFRFVGNFLNLGNQKVLLDGASITYTGYAGAAFPNAIDASNPNAKSDCDPKKAGAQLIFGGDSHVVVADGSLEVCAGPYPNQPQNHQAIGVFGVPAVDSIPGEVILSTGQEDGLNPLDPNNALKIDNMALTFRYGNCAAFCGGSHRNAWAVIKMKPYTPPAGYKVVKIQARVSYNPKNAGCAFLFSCSGAAPQLSTYDGSTGNNQGNQICRRDYPKNPDRGNLQMANLSTGLLYEEGNAGAQCTTPALLAAGARVAWDARAECVVGVCKAGGGYWTDTLDGIEFEVTIAPTDTSKPWLRPQSGCITTHPNYNAGEGAPDCAILRSNTALLTDNYSFPWSTREGQSVGRWSVHGTIYAPSAAADIDDGDAAYMLADRGAVLRHLRIAGYGPRPGTDNVAIGHNVDRTPLPRDGLFVACKRSSSNVNATDPCGDLSGDVILTRARVRFDIDPSSSIPDTQRARVANVQWWSTRN